MPQSKRRYARTRAQTLRGCTRYAHGGITTITSTSVFIVPLAIPTVTASRLHRQTTAAEKSLTGGSQTPCCTPSPSRPLRQSHPHSSPPRCGRAQSGAQCTPLLRHVMSIDPACDRPGDSDTAHSEPVTALASRFTSSTSVCEPHADSHYYEDIAKNARSDTTRDRQQPRSARRDPATSISPPLSP